jgi:copper chaperone CopZ
MISMYFIVIRSFVGWAVRPPHLHVERARGRIDTVGQIPPPCFHGGLALARYTLGGYAFRRPDERPTMTLPETNTADFAVAGMTCGNCARHVTEEIEGVPGVASVDVDLVAGGVSTVTVRSAHPVDANAITVAVAEAGYRVVSR